jgi:hypothetical protein
MNLPTLLRTVLSKSRFVSLIIAACHMLAACSSSTSASFITFQRSGGFMGLDDTLTIEASGKARLTQRGGSSIDFQVAQDKLSQLQQLFDATGFARLNASYQGSAGADLITYRVSYKSHTVRAVDGAVPAELQPILDELNEIVDSKPSP